MPRGLYGGANPTVKKRAQTRSLYRWTPRSKPDWMVWRILYTDLGTVRFRYRVLWPNPKSSRNKFVKLALEDASSSGHPNVRMNMFLTSDFVIRSYGDEKFILVEPLVYEGRLELFKVPPGHYTDFASVPQVFTWLIPRYGAYTRAAILHDYFCDTGVVSRRDADGLFRRILRELRVSLVRRWMMWGAVRAASKMSDANAKEWAQFILVALLSIPFILIPTLVVGLWTLIFKIIDIPAKIK